MEDQSLFKGLEAFEELQSPFHLFTVLHKDLEVLNRLKRNHKKSVLVSSVLTGLHFGDDGPDPEDRLDLTGRRLGKYLNDPEADRLCSKLVSNPMDSESRQKLVVLMLEQRDHINLQMSRDGYLFSLFQLENPQISAENINMGLYCQEIYFQKLLEELKEISEKDAQ